MTRRFLALSCTALLLSYGSFGVRAETTPPPSFMASLDPAIRAAIGVDGMTPAQLAALEAAVTRYTQGTPAPSRQSSAAAVALAAQLTEPPSLLNRARGMLRPDTRIEYAREETTLAEPFKGWRSGTIFSLANGQRWRVTGSDYWAREEPAGKAVVIEPGALGSFFLAFEGVRSRPRVELVGEKTTGRGRD